MEVATLPLLAWFSSSHSKTGTSPVMKCERLSPRRPELMLASTNCSVTVVRLQTLIGALRENEAPNDALSSTLHALGLIVRKALWLLVLLTELLLT